MSLNRDTKLIEQDIVVRFGISRLVAKVGSVLADINTDPFDLYRSHVSRDIAAEEVPYRRALDELCDALSLLSIVSGNLVQALDRHDIALGKIYTVFKHEAIERYIFEHYPSGHAMLVRAELIGSLPPYYFEILREEMRSEIWPSCLSRFLGLEAQFADQKLQSFLLLLDDYVVADVHISHLERAFQSAEAMNAWLAVRDRTQIIAGLEQFLTFCEELDGLLQYLEPIRVLRGRIWLHHSYWFGFGGDRIQRALDWLVAALLNASPNGHDQNRAIDQIRLLFANLTDPNYFASDLVLFSGDVLVDWPTEAGPSIS